MVDPAPVAPAPVPAKNAWWKRLGNLGGSTLGILVLLLLAVAAADRAKFLIDLSADHRFTVSDELQRIVTAQTADIHLVGIWSTNVPIDTATIATALGQVCQLNPHLTWNHLDPDLDKPLVDKFRETYHQAADPALYATRGDRAFLIPLTPATRFYLQRDLGGALIALSTDHPTTAVILQGHGELRPDGGAEDGCNQLLSDLTLSGFAVVTDDPANPATISPNAVVIIPGPTRPLGDATIARLETHLRDGGGMLILADDRCPPDLVHLLQRHGVFTSAGFPAALVTDHPEALADVSAPSVPPMAVHSMGHHFAGQELEFPYAKLIFANQDMVNPAPDTPTVSVAKGVTILSPRSAAIEAITADWIAHLNNDAAVKALVPPAMYVPAKHTWLLQTEPGDAWIQPFNAPLKQPKGLDHADNQRIAQLVDWPADPHSVRENVGAEAVIWGSRQAASDGVLGQAEFANADLLIAAARTLARGEGAETAQAIPQANVRQFQVVIGEDALYLLICALVLFVPMICIGAAMLMWWDRR
jgi:hypothetical protein